MVVVGIGVGSISAKAHSIYTSPYVSFSPDRQAWTTDAGNTNIKWYKEDGSDDVETGVISSLGELGVGQHYYGIRRQGSIPVAKWKVHTSAVNCCHNAYPSDGEFHGIDFVMQTCYKPHFSAWRPICADCGQQIAKCNFYFSKEAALSLDYLEIQPYMSYYYLCPFNRNLEQGATISYHDCRAISPNRYRVLYHANAGGGAHSGYMAPSFHMYDDAEQYEGRPVTPQVCLNPNTYQRIGWEFVGWNTESDGSGVFYRDGAQIYNLCTEDYGQDAKQGTVHLYAMWRASKSILAIDPAGGIYDGSEVITEVEGAYGSSYMIREDKVIAPPGASVSFDTCGGKTVDAIRGNMIFQGWSRETPFYGRLTGAVYTFGGMDGSRDVIRARYGREAIVLPKPERDNYSFGGWFYDEHYEKPAGAAGDLITPSEDLILYAQWVALVLDSEENYEVDKAGAVDLEWSQPDGQNKSFKLYQCVAGQEWNQIYDADAVQREMVYQAEFYCNGREQRFAAPFSGFYHIAAYGAQGGDYMEYSGGLGGLAEGSFWLEKGQCLKLSVGGIDGYNNGGDGDVYAYGGGGTVVSAVGEDGKDTIWIIAGGGGGAGSCGSGGAGGLQVGLVESGHYGESGAAGGGGGYIGGCAGEVLVHNHVEGICNHVHEGNATEKGGCYTEPVTCGEKLEHIHTSTETWYWGGSDESYCPNCGADASKGEDCTGHTTKHYRHNCPIHGKRASNTSSSSPSKCTAVKEYALSCGRTEDYFCGYPYDGYVISSNPAYGGSSYLNSSVARSYREVPGVREGNGYVLIEAEDVGYCEDTKLTGVSAKDLAAPCPIDLETLQKAAVTEKIVALEWEEPQDLGTVYYHRAESYPVGSDIRLSVSNITSDTMVSGVRGYLFRIDDVLDTELHPSNAILTTRTKHSVSFTEENQYVHVAVMDWAGNYSKTVHIPLGNRVDGAEGVKWPVYTRQLKLEDTDYVHYADQDRTYYVRADGRTPFTLYYEAYMEGTATRNYQITRAALESRDEDDVVRRTTTKVPSCYVTDVVYELAADQLQFQSDGKDLFQVGNYSMAVRSERCRNLALTQEIIPNVESHGRIISLTPIAGVDNVEEVIYSDYTEDSEHCLWIIGDGQGPDIQGLEALEGLDVLDRREQSIQLEVKAEDDLSGVRDFYLEIENRDNDARCIVRPDDTGVIQVDLCADEPLYSGDFTVTACAVDNVGNESAIGYSTMEFDLQASVERILAPHDPLFKCGESGVLYIKCWGYAERIEIIFPEEMTAVNPEINHVYEYPLKGSYVQEEAYEFMIPLNTPYAQDYKITVRAYKGDKMLEQYPAMAVVGINGSILDELRTRLR